MCISWIISVCESIIKMSKFREHCSSLHQDEKQPIHKHWYSNDRFEDEEFAKRIVSL